MNKENYKSSTFSELRDLILCAKKLENADIASKWTDVRNELDLSMTEMAKHLGVSLALISRIESGSRTPNSNLMEKFYEFYVIEGIKRMDKKKWENQIYHASMGKVDLYKAGHSQMSAIFLHKKFYYPPAVGKASLFIQTGQCCAKNCNEITKIIIDVDDGEGQTRGRLCFHHRELLIPYFM